VDDRFVGVNTGEFDETIGGALFAEVSGHNKLGFQSTLTFQGGEIDATAAYDVTVETNYNKTTDQLLLDTSAVVTEASFDTVGPTGSYVLDFIYDILLNARAGVDIDLGELGSITESVSIGTIDIGPGSFNVLDRDSDTLAGTIEFPPPLDAFSVNFDWPNITTSGDFPPNPVTGDGDIDLLDVDVIGGLNFLQDFALSLGELTGILTFEDGSSRQFEIGDSLLIDDASDIDAGGNADGLVEFQFDVVPTATLHNETDLGFNIGVEVSLLSVELGYDIGVASDSTTLGPLAQFGATAPIGDINVFDATFGLNFTHDQVFGFA
jgi:hypothetical protein